MSGADHMMNSLERARREEIRWRLLVGLDAGRPYPVNERILFRLLHDVQLPLTPNELRRELDYLKDRGLVSLVGEAENDWNAELTRHGVDVVEYTVDCQPGIARPPHNR